MEGLLAPGPTTTARLAELESGVYVSPGWLSDRRSVENQIAMTEQLDLFAEPGELRPEQPAEPPMTQDQRAEIRSLFEALRIDTARNQFDVVNVLIGVRLECVADLDSKSAAKLIPRLQQRVDSQGKTLTGSSWTDREEETWIDNL